MRDWAAFVRARLPLDDLTPSREARIVRELANQLEDVYQDARSRGLGDAAADAWACSQVTDWPRLAADVRQAGRTHRLSLLDRYANPVDVLADATRSRFSPGSLMLTLLRHLRLSIRQLLRAPMFAAVVIITMGLAIGAATAMFSVINGVLLRPLPYGHPESLVRLYEIVPQFGRFSVAPATYLDWRDQAGVFERMASYASTSGTFAGTDAPERVPGATVTWNVFETLGVSAALGATFTAENDAPGHDHVLVISHGLWQRRFGSDASLVGRTVSLNGEPATIVGIMPPNFYFPTRTIEYWQPMAIDAAKAPRGAHYLGVVARLRPGVGSAEAGAAVKALSERLARQYPDSSANESAEVIPVHEQVVGRIRPALLTLFAAVVVVVLIACANVANLLLARASSRQREVAVRTALGASRARLIVEALVESTVLATAGGTLGLLIAYGALRPIRALGAVSIPRVADVTIDPRVLLFTMGVSLLTGLIFGLAPAWHAVRSGVGAALPRTARSVVGPGSRRVRQALIVVEVALSIVLLVGAALLLRSFSRLTSVDPGFQPERALAFQVSLPGSAYREDPSRIGFYNTLLEKLRRTPGVTAAGMVQTLPLRGSYTLSFGIEGRPAAGLDDDQSANHRVVSPGYFEALGIPLKRGRAITPQDTATSERVAAVDEAFARRYFPNEDPIGHALRIGNGTDTPYRIVGVVGDVHQGGLDAVMAPTMYVPHSQDVFSTMWIVVRTAGEPLAFAGTARSVLRSIDAGLPAYSIASLASVVSDSVAERRFSMFLLAVFAAVALVLASVGLYGVVAYMVTGRTREIGLRVAIGAAPGAVLRMVMRDGMTLAILGVAIGLAGAFTLAGVVRSLLYDTAPTDPLSYAGTALLMLAISALACYLPARRATRVDPLTALRSE